MKIVRTSQNTNDILLYLAVICLCFVIFLLYTALSSRGRTLTGPATVASRRGSTPGSPAASTAVRTGTIW